MRIIRENDPYDVKCAYRYQALIYLAFVEKKDNRFIADLFGYAMSTVRTYKWKYADKLEEAKELFKEYILHETLENPYEYDLDTSGQYFYLIKFYNHNDEFLVSKVGTTTQTLRKRLKDHFKSNTPYYRRGASYLIIDKVYECTRNPKGIENALKGELMKKYDLVGNDQFEVDLNWDDYEDFIQNYLDKYPKV